MIDIVTPVYNADRFLEQTVHSVMRQTVKDWRLWLVLDSATNDNSLEIVDRLARTDSRVLKCLAPQRGVAAARNHGLDQVRGDAIAFLDADDLWLPTKLERQLEALTTADIVCTGHRRIDQHGLRVGRLQLPPEAIDYARLLEQNCILQSSAMVRTSVVGDLRFEERGCEDFVFWLRLLKQGARCLGLRQDLARYRIVGGSRGSNAWRTLRESFAIQKEFAPHLGFGLRSRFLWRGCARHWRF